MSEYLVRLAASVFSSHWLAFSHPAGDGGCDENVEPSSTCRYNSAGGTIELPKAKRLPGSLPKPASSNTSLLCLFADFNPVALDNHSKFKNREWPLDSGKKDRMKTKVTVFSFVYHSGSGCTLVLFSRNTFLLGMLFALTLKMDCHGVPLVYLHQPHSEGKHNQSSTNSFSCRMKSVEGASLFIDKFIPLCFQGDT